MNDTTTTVDGRSGSDEPSGLRPFGAEPQDASQAKPLVPNADGPPSTWLPRRMAPKNRRILVLCDERAPWPVMIGAWNGEKYVSKDANTEGKTWGVLGWLPLPEPGPILVYPPTCSFCGKDSEAVKKLIAGPAVMICDECVALCEGIIAEKPLAQGIDARSGTTGTGVIGEADESPVAARGDAPNESEQP